jgi:simple sugar transport system permease protein
MTAELLVEETTSRVPARGAQMLKVAGRWAAALAGAVVVFSVVLITKGADPVTVFADAWRNTFMTSPSLQDIVIKAGPFALAALAVVVPARAGLVNVGGEGQVLIGAVAAGGTGLALDQHVGGGLVVVCMLAAGMAAGAAWAGLAAALRLTVKVNEAVSTLLLNYVALDVLLFLIYQPWKDPHGSGQPATRPLATGAALPHFPGSTVHVGILLVLVAAVVVWAGLTRSVWGFKLAAVGGNQEAARRAGLPVNRLLLSAMLVGGALAGLAGVIHFAGVEHQLRPGMVTNIGYIGFLASWLSRHKPLAVLASSFVLAGLTVAGDSLQIDAGLPAATANILTGLVLIAVLGWTSKGAKA